MKDLPLNIQIFFIYEELVVGYFAYEHRIVSFDKDIFFTSGFPKSPYMKNKYI